MKKITLLLALFSFILSISQNVTTIDFETVNDGYTPSTTWQSGWTDVFNRTNFNMSNVTNEDGYYWAVEDISITDPNIVLNQINVSGSSSFTFSIDMTTHHYNDWDESDELLITYSVDSGSYQNLMAVQMVTEGSGSGTNEPAALDTDFDGAGDCGTDTTLPSISTGTGSQGCSNSSIGKNFKTFTRSSISLSSNSTLDIKLQFNGLTSNDEGIYLDNIIITETSASNDLTVTSDQTISSDVSYDNVTVNAGNTLTIAKNGSLNISADLTNNGTVILQSASDEFASLIIQGTSSGNITYKRFVSDDGTDEWDLIGSPVTGQDINTFASTNSTPLATAGGAGSDQYAIGLYDNSNDSWVNYNTSSIANAGDFDLGKGYQIGTDSGATLAFTGTIATTDQTVAIIDNDAANSGSGRIWNLIANPFPSYLNANSATSGTNFITVNESNLHSSYAAIYGYDADGSGYTIYNNSSSATYIAPGQAFFVASDDSGGNTVTFSEAMQTVTGTDDFIAGRLANTSSELYLKLYEGENLVGDTKFYFDNNLSLGLDPGYDAGAYNQSSALASRLAEDDQGVNMGINAMGIDSFEQTTIPLVVNRQAGTSFRISLEDLTIPESVEVFLEDTETQNFTNLRTEDFTLNPQSDLSGMGRFYLRLGNTSLGGSDLEESYISIYNPMDKDYITIEGLANIQKANVRLYNIIGQEILNKTLQTGQSTQNISTAGLTMGIYVIKLQVDSTLISKKIVIN